MCSVPILASKKNSPLVKVSLTVVFCGRYDSRVNFFVPKKVISGGRYADISTIPETNRHQSGNACQLIDREHCLPNSISDLSEFIFVRQWNRYGSRGSHCSQRQSYAQERRYQCRAHDGIQQCGRLFFPWSSASAIYAHV